MLPGEIIDRPGCGICSIGVLGSSRLPNFVNEPSLPDGRPVRRGLRHRRFGFVHLLPDRGLDEKIAPADFSLPVSPVIPTRNFQGGSGQVEGVADFAPEVATGVDR
jgi:hypothetical protein